MPFAPGGAADLVARSMERMAMKHFGKAFITTNMPGSGGVLGLDTLASAEPDGYTIGIVNTSALLQSEYSPTKYDYPTALQPLVQIMSTPVAIVTLANNPWQNINEFIAYAKTHPGEIKYAHPGLGTSPHITGEMFARAAGIDIGHVPYMGDSETLAALLGEHVKVMFVPPFVVKEFVKIGRVKVLAVASEQRMTDPLFKDIPTFREHGLEVVYNAWLGIAIPKRMDKAIQDKLTAVLIDMVNDPEYKEQMEKLEMQIDFLGPDEFLDKWMHERERLCNFVKVTGIAEAVRQQRGMKAPVERGI